MIILRSVFILMPISIYMALIYTPPANILGESSRIIYFHVPAAWISVIAFAVAGITSILYLFVNSRKDIYPTTAYNSAYIGIIFTVLTLISGSIWAKISWGSYWNWDPRETSMLILLMIYIAYFALSGSLENQDNSAKISSSYLIFAALIMPFFVFIIPRVYPSLHPNTVINSENKVKLITSMKLTLLLSTISFTLLYFYILKIMNRITKLEKRLEKNNEY